MAPRRPQEGPTVSEGKPTGGTPRAALTRGTTIGRYLLLDPVGQGGMGVVYRAYDPELDRQVALKLLHGGDEESSTQRDRLLREAQALARLQHPNVIAVYDAGTFGRDVFIAMEFVDGQTLRRWLQSQRRERREILRVFLAAGEGLAAAHLAGLVHRDFKPENVIVGSDGRVRVLDFGLARRADAATPAAAAPPTQSPALEAPIDATVEGGRPARRTELERTISDDAPLSPSPSAPGFSSPKRLAMPLTHAGAIVGTPRYMAPEQHQGQATDERADQFSFCVSLYHALYDSFPFAGEVEPEFLDHMLRGEIAEAPAGSTVPRWLRQVLLRGLAARPQDRHPSMQALLAALRADPRIARERRLRAVVALSVPLLGVAAWQVVHHRGLQKCAGAELRLAGVWDGPRRAAVGAAFARSGLSYAGKAWGTVENALDRYAQAWTGMHTDACEATQVRHEQSQELLDLRMSCLDGRLTQLRTLSDVFAAADDKVIAHSVESVQSLPSLEPCADAVALHAPLAPPHDPRTRAEVEAIRQKLARVHALGQAKPSDELLGAARTASREAQALHYSPIEAEAQLQLGELQEERGDFAEAVKSLHRAWVAALAGHHDTVGAWAATDLIRALGVSQGHYEEGDRWADVAEAVVGHLQRGDSVLGALYANRSELRKEESRYPDAVRDGKRAIELLGRALGPDDQSVAETYNTLGNIYRDQQQFPAALDAYHHSLAIWLRLGGPDHPKALASQTGVADVYGDSGQHERALAEYQRVLAAFMRVEPDSPNVANVRNNMGTELMALGRPREAFEAYRLALADWQKRVGPSTETITGLNNLGSASLELDALADAERYFQEALDVSEKLLGPKHLYCGLVLQGLGDTRLRRGERDQAMADYQRSLAIVEKALDAKNPRLVASLVGIGRVEIERHDLLAARAPLERALAIGEAQPEDGRELNEVRVALAEALWPVGERRRALALATLARDGLAKVGPRARRDLAEVTTWLRSHR